MRGRTPFFVLHLYHFVSICFEPASPYYTLGEHGYWGFYLKMNTSRSRCISLGILLLIEYLYRVLNVNYRCTWWCLWNCFFFFCFVFMMIWGKRWDYHYHLGQAVRYFTNYIESKCLVLGYIWFCLLSIHLTSFPFSPPCHWRPI